MTWMLLSLAACTEEPLELPDVAGEEAATDTGADEQTGSLLFPSLQNEPDPVLPVVDTSETGSDTEEVVPCEHTLDPGQLVLNREGWRLEDVVAELDAPTALDVAADGTVYLGAGMGTWNSRAVVRVSPDGTLSGSSGIPDPDGVGLDASGTLFAGGSDDIWKVGSLEGGADSVVATLGGVNINDLLVDRLRDDAVYVGLNDGRAMRYATDGTWTELVGSGDEISIALDPEGDLWAIRRNQGTVIEVDTSTGLELSRVELASTARPGLLRVNRIVFDGDGVMALSAYVQDDGAQIALWDPAEPTAMPDLLEGMEHDDLHPDDVHWSPDFRCVYVSLPLVGRVIRACSCEG